MRLTVCCTSILCFAIGCGADSEPALAPEMSIKLMTPIQQPQSRYRLVAQITNFDPAAGLHGQLEVHNVEGQQVFPIDAVADARIEIDTDTLPAMHDQAMSILLRGAAGTQSLQDRMDWKSGPPDIVTTTPTVGDAGTITLTGYGLGSPILMVLGLRATPEASEKLVEIFSFAKVDATTCKGVVPVVLSTDEPSIFTGRVPPARVFLRYFTDSGLTDVPVGTTQLAYRISRPVPVSGAAGSTFDVTLFHPARAPDLAGLTVSFDDMALAPQSVTELGDITAGGFIYLTRSTFVVPASASPGLHHVTARTEFGDEFLSNGPDFTVVDLAR
jgi:hypothetical protein